MTPVTDNDAGGHDRGDAIRTTRRNILKGGLVGAGAVLVAPQLLSGTASAATLIKPAGRPTLLSLVSPDRVNGSGVTPFGRHLMFGRDPASQMNIGWQVPVPVESPFIRVGLNPLQLDRKVAAEVRPLTTQSSVVTAVDSLPLVKQSIIEQFYLHASLSGLEPGQTYYYAVGHRGFDPGRGFSAGQIASFTTGPARSNSRSPFTFTAFGDQGISYDAVLTGNLIAAQNPAFHLHAGDISYAESGGGGLLNDSYDPRVWDGWFVETEAVASTIPWMVTVGNHEMEQWYSPNGYGGQLARFDFLGNGPGNAPTVYSFKYGNAAVLALDVNDVSYEIPANLFYTGANGGTQATWLAQTVARYRKDPEIDFIIAFFHQCAYCTCSVHASDEGPRQFWAPIFDKYDIDLVISGHNHIYERTDPLRGGAPTMTAPTGATIDPTRSGTTYMNVGAGGVSLYSFPVADSYEGNLSSIDSVPTYFNSPGSTKTNETVEWSRVRYTGYILLVVDSEPAAHGGGLSTLTCRAINEFGTEIDNVVLSRASS